jgi:uncharacterized protein YndB with AHSA1/START domain
MAQAEAKKLVVTLPSDREIRLTRTFDAPRALVFEAFTKAEHVARWWGLPGDELVIDAFDARPGGRWRFVSRGADGSENGFRGEIREIVPNERIVQTFEWEGLPGHVSVETMTFEERDGKTTIVGTSRFDSVEDRDGMLQSGMEGGAAESYHRLEELLKTIA